MAFLHRFLLCILKVNFLLFQLKSSLFFSRYAASVGAKHYHTSAKLNKGIEEMFLDLSKGKHCG